MATVQHRRVSLKDLAKAADLSISTVSEILNGKKQNYSSESTRQLVFQTAARLGYRPNIGYKIMLGKKTKTVAIVSSIKRVAADEHIKDLILLLMQKLEYMGYSSYICTLFKDAATNLLHIEELISRGVDHFVMIGTPVGHDKIQELLKKEGRTYIGYGSLFDRDVSVDVAGGAEKILKFFLQESRENFKMLMGEPQKEEYRNFGFLALKRVFPKLPDEELCKRYVIPIKKLGDMTDDFEKYAYNLGYQLTGSALDKAPEIQAFFYSNDYFALGGSRALMERHLKIGKDTAIAGCNNINAVRFHSFPISSIKHDITEISEIIVHEFSDTRPFHQILASSVIIRKPSGWQ